MRPTAWPTLLVLLLWIGACRDEDAAVRHDPLTKTAVVDVMERVADWQLAHPKHDLWEWENGAFYAGVMAAYRSTGRQRYLEAAQRMGVENDWKPGPRRRHADDHAIAQTYIEIFQLTGDRRMIASFRDTVDVWMTTQPDWEEVYQPIDYWWCDALFMSPPALAGLAAATGEERYLDFMDRRWRETFALLYDPTEHLFFRDVNFKIDPDGTGPRGPGGEKIFWSRGNGWVLAGTARLLALVPPEWPQRGFYVDIYSEMAQRIVALQPKDGLWRPSLLGPEHFPNGESSGSAFFTYALAWGVNQGMLDRDLFIPAIEHAWTALVMNVNEEGRLGWVQPIGAQPDRTKREDWEVYGSGAFLLAGSEVLALVTTTR